MKIIRSGSVPSAPGPEAYFTGRVRLDSPFRPMPRRASAERL
jgi:hypothetical protein